MGDRPFALRPRKEHRAEIICSLPELDFPEELNLGHYLLDRHIIEGRGERTALLFQERKITFSNLQKEANRLANARQGLGVVKNDRVILEVPEPTGIHCGDVCVVESRSDSRIGAPPFKIGGDPFSNQRL